ncbi:PREDICTED: dual specificity protein phosphatase 1-like [Nelumbo nucifera]|uniref:Dual specificity protein phosphatase 1-like n=2 Tax=Nelumbo nucifera TaxID=4432 RepID=A0A1U8Q3C8_NELNU|nr:PREDICTED: dual specificity protein phosphatase 1-like [Nelumbo nucifera]XP_010251081.1 PREDICTED: dual specificity protein phosphatase 1-like [Nelumbo nucifera]XP_010251082.1 PREDICTED: dual specificity protein phosphatase 1-like [Nelumbo nucifera]XP_019052540.1 PREDICTED: dual specificity protein phosphatase 1-like [Nelumbo nucifera]DAD34458.1 TPA_asm: hypothetical protein HUJ06_005098 [Nelumbo nucifera]
MDHFEQVYRNQISALARLVCAVKCVKDDTVPCRIEEGLFLGSLGAASNKNVLKGLNVTHILTVANLPAQSSLLLTSDFMCKTVEVADKEDMDIVQHFDECFNFIDEAKRVGGGVLIHCFMGRSRSVTVVVAYLMKKHHMCLSQALDYVKSKRPQAAPNPGFMLQLLNFEKSLRGES